MDDEMAGHSPAHDEGRAPESEGGPPAGLFRIAASMARKGRYQEALRALRQAVAAEECSDAEALDLQARIYAQQGMLLRAESCWTEALRKDPGNANFTAALARLHRSYARPLHGARLLFFGAIIALIAVLGFMADGYYHMRRQQDQMSSKLTLIESSLRGMPIASRSMQEDKANGPNLGITVPGIAVRNDGGHLMVTFNSGLFARGTRLSPNAKPLLFRLARQLEPHAPQISIRMTGFTDSTAMPANGRYIDNAALGMARALRVVEYMRSTSRLPAEVFSLEGQGTTGAPYPNDSSENRLRNRTVVMRVSSKH